MEGLGQEPFLLEKAGDFPCDLASGPLRNAESHMGAAKLHRFVPLMLQPASRAGGGETRAPPPPGARRHPPRVRPPW
jgi:hypothetical protein